MKLLKFIYFGILICLVNAHLYSANLLPGIIRRDAAGIPTIFAKTEKEAYFLLGYQEAVDRFFQMDIARHYYEGKLAELLGAKHLAPDRAIRQVGLPYYASHSLPALSSHSRVLLHSFSDGVNAFLKQNLIPKEYRELHLTKKSISKWTITDSLAITRGVNANVDSLAMSPAINSSQVISFDPITQTQSYLNFLQEGKRHGFDGVKLWFDDIYRSAPNTKAVTVANFFEKKAFNKQNKESTYKNSSAIDQNKLLLLNPTDIGSNIFVVDGKHTTTGFPMMANDSHYPLYSPPLWYLINIQVGDHKNPINAHLSVLMPGSFIYKSGYNHQIVWGSTTSRVNISDVYLERLKLDKSGIPTAAYFKGKTMPLNQIKQIYYYNTFAGDRLAKATRDPIKDDTFLIPYRNNGPLISIKGQKGYGIQSTIYGNIYARDINGYLELPHANNLKHFESVIHLLDTSYYNFGYMDQVGNIAFYESGEIPIRKDLAEGNMISPPFFLKDSALGDKNSWIPLKNIPPDQSLPYKIIPFINMPHVINPAQGFFVNSNNDPVGLTLNNSPLSNHYLPDGGIYYLGFKHATGERAEQITRLIQEKFTNNKKISLNDMMAIQTNTQSLLAKQFMPYILKAFANAKSNDPEIIEAIGRLRNWSFTTSEDSVAATIFYLWQSYFLTNTVEKTLTEHHLPVVSYAIATQTSLHLLKIFDKTWGMGASGINFFSVKNIHNPKQARDYLILKSLHQALETLKRPNFAKVFGGKTQNEYHWGKLHRVIFKNIIGKNYPLSGSIARDGGIETINAANFNGLAIKPDDFIFSSGATLRRIIEITPDKVISLVSLPGGESEEETSPFFSNMLNKWLKGDYYQEK